MNETYGAEAKRYRAAIYARLSREDGDKAESDSIAGQKALLHAFADNRPELEICAEWVDDGYSGASFDRPAFTQLMEQLHAGSINCVLVKDLSRFGRNYIDAGRLLEEVFPLLGVRFIAVNDQYDSADKNAAASQILVPFKNLINDAYCRDISRKIKSQLDIKRRQGDFVGAFAPYGYRKAANDPNRLEPEPATAQMVRQIFRWRLEGVAQRTIAKRLNERGADAPAEQQRAAGARYGTPFQNKARAAWSAEAVGRVLENEICLGVLEQGKSGSVNFRVKRRGPKPKEDWARVENAHEPLVSKQVFDCARRLGEQTSRAAPGGDGAGYLLGGLLFCGDCGAAMVRKTVPSGAKQYHYYVCAAHKAGRGCAPHRISAPCLEEAVLAVTGWFLALAHPLPPYRRCGENAGLAAARRQKEEELSAARGLLLGLYGDWKDGILEEWEYQELKASYAARCDALEQEAAAQREWAEQEEEREEERKADRITTVALVEKILIEEGGQMELLLTFRPGA